VGGIKSGEGEECQSRLCLDRFGQSSSPAHCDATGAGDRARLPARRAWGSPKTRNGGTHVAGGAGCEGHTLQQDADGGLAVAAACGPWYAAGGPYNPLAGSGTPSVHPMVLTARPALACCRCGLTKLGSADPSCGACGPGDGSRGTHTGVPPHLACGVGGALMASHTPRGTKSEST